jgi:hypothetical protein
MAQQQLADADITMDGANLYHEETFTDRRIGSVQRLTPVTRAGARDASRRVLFVGQTQVLTPAGALPRSFELDAETLDQAIEKFGEAAQEALAGALKRLDELRREAASSLIVPGAGGGQGPGGPGGFGGPHGGGIQIP